MFQPILPQFTINTQQQSKMDKSYHVYKQYIIIYKELEKHPS